MRMMRRPISLSKILPFLVLIPLILALIWSFYSILRHRSGEPWIYMDHFFFTTFLLSLLKLEYQTLLWLRDKGYFEWRGRKLPFVKEWIEYRKEGFSRWSSHNLRIYLAIWNGRPSREVILSRIILPRIWVLFHLGLGAWESSLVPLQGSLWVILIPLIVNGYLSLLGKLLDGKMDGLWLLWDITPEQMENPPDYNTLTWSQKALSLGYKEEDREKVMEYFFLVGGGILTLEEFQKWKRKIILPFNILMSLGYVILWFLFFWKIYLS